MPRLGRSRPARAYLFLGRPLAAGGGTGTANAGLAAGTGASQSPVPGVLPAAGLAAGTGTAQSPVPDVIPAGGLAAGTGTALSVTFAPPAGYLFIGDGWTILYYLDYLDLGTAETLRAVPGSYYSMQAVNSRPGLTDPPPDGRWQGGMDMMAMTDMAAPSYAEMLHAGKAHNSRLQARLARGEKIADLEALISRGEAT